MRLYTTRQGAGGTAQRRLTGAPPPGARPSPPCPFRPWPSRLPRVASSTGGPGAGGASRVRARGRGWMWPLACRAEARAQRRPRGEGGLPWRVSAAAAGKGQVTVEHQV